MGGGLGSPLAGFSPNTEISFLMISPYLLNFCPVLLLIFSPLETADFLMLLEPSGDGYSLLCSKKQPPWHTGEIDSWTPNSGSVMILNIYYVSYSIQLKIIIDLRDKRQQTR